jgi:cellulose synthase/poly-beta-1,6-N-acetylglucosamine synthase-like glycosyltransferase
MIARMASVVFWTCCVLLAYIYALYPILVELLAPLLGVAPRRGTALPTVTVIVTAYNEEKCIRAKLDNLSRLAYPRELVTIIVASDGSSDATDAIAAGYDPGRVRVVRLEGRRGKTACQNAAAAAAAGEILVFTDATTEVDAAALGSLVQCFGDESVGCVGGRLVYVSEGEHATGRGGEAYWSYETRLRLAESRLGSMIGVSGCLYAVRRRAYRPVEPDLISDFVIAMRMQEQGLRVVLAAEAVCYEVTLSRGSQELAMRVRVALRSLNALLRERRFLNPLRYGRFAWQLWSHKVLRYASPLLWLAALVSNALLSFHGLLYLGLLLAQLAVIAAGIVGFVLQASGRALGVFARPYYFLLTNLASLIAMLRYLRGERMITWQPIRDAGGAGTRQA